jgi:hypothetical protein
MLAVGGCLPADLSDRERVEAPLVIIASDHTEYTSTISFQVERRAVKPKFMKRESSLYAEPTGRRIKPLVGDSIAPISGGGRDSALPDRESDI